MKCKHCGLYISDLGYGWIHDSGGQAGKHRCALEPYGYDAEPVGEPCSFACRGHQEWTP